MKALIAGIVIAAFAGVAPSDIAALRTPGTPVPAAALPSLSGGNLSLRNDDGRPTVIVVFASWCDPCRKNMPAILNLAKTSSARFVGIDALESMDAARAFVKASNVTFPTALLTSAAFDGPGVTDDQRGTTGIDIPAVYVIDENGKSYEAFVGENALQISHVKDALRQVRPKLQI